MQKTFTLVRYHSSLRKWMFQSGHLAGEAVLTSMPGCSPQKFLLTLGKQANPCSQWPAGRTCAHHSWKSRATDSLTAFPSALRPPSQAGRDAGTPSRGTVCSESQGLHGGKAPEPGRQEQRYGPGSNPNYSMGQVGTDHSGPTSQSARYRIASRWFPTISSDGDSQTLWAICPKARSPAQ